MQLSTNNLVCDGDRTNLENRHADLPITLLIDAGHLVATLRGTPTMEDKVYYAELMHDTSRSPARATRDEQRETMEDER